MKMAKTNFLITAGPILADLEYSACAVPLQIWVVSLQIPHQVLNHTLCTNRQPVARLQTRLNVK